MKTISILCGMVVLSIAAGTGWARETEPVYCFRVFPNERSCLGRLEGANHRSRLVEDATAQSRGRNRIEIAGEAPTPTRDARVPADLDERRVTAIPGLRVDRCRSREPPSARLTDGCLETCRRHTQA